ncbi:UDP-2,3-diacylglucosamine hydrolase [Balneicella halophila]|uniref:UDP-2,3-diacylglucosamine hydrolase n=1 Tax=Balneicella halophila TaxID=1537566 RepID=A0A7L4UNM2_BALHA|nr:UDP-2,3-diacylglucosamine diphosphatase [Balneicella halophila]PVX49887.1 UDP-2,3-diacylglucosamine hydrolase [Balneicella halophila]
MSKTPVKIYFASDLHLGARAVKNNRVNELRFVRWLEEVRKDATAIYLLGDIFDFWFEYKRAVPKGGVRLLGKIAEIVDSGIPVHFFAGNHDAWLFGYFEEELGVTVHHKPIDITLSDKKFQIGHGDGLGPGDKFYKFMKVIMDNKLCRFLFRWLHPDIGLWIAHQWSKKSREKSDGEDVYLGNDKEWLYQYCQEELKREHYDFMVFGHRHLDIDVKLNDAGSRYINIGEWFSKYTYGVFNGEGFTLKKYTN